MTDVFVEFRQVSFTYGAASGPLLEELSAHFPRGWTGVVGVNGAGKSTVLELATGLLAAGSGVVVGAEHAIYCPQRTDIAPDGLTQFLDAQDGAAHGLRGRLGIHRDWGARWDTLSHGERKRAQIGVALWRAPPVLAIDEPTNHIDRAAAQLLLDGLRSYRGVGLLVSHDREMLDALCTQCLFLDPPAATMRPGGYSDGAREAVRELEAARDELRLARRERKRLERESQSRREEATRMVKRRSKRGLAIKDHDARVKRDAARLSGKDGVGGRRHRQIQGRVERARDAEQRIDVKSTQESGIWLPGERSNRSCLARAAEGELALGERRRLAFQELVVGPDDRIALTGPNGAGKSTLVDLIVSRVELPPERLVYLPQEIDLASSRHVLDQARGLPGEQLGRMMAIVSRLGSRPRRLLDSTSPSPGEIRKLLLAIGISRQPHLIVLDEPTNHLDLTSIECLESALEDCPCALLLVSHDERFLARLTRTRWQIQPDGAEAGRYVVGVSQRVRG